jgi:hypothetical protein
VKLTNGRTALVDDEDYERVSALVWWEQDGYAMRQVRPGGRKAKARRVWMHRFVLGIEQPYPDVEVDHLDSDGLNNQRANLRVVTKAENQQNRQKQRSPASSRFKGVSRDDSDGRTKPWRAYIRVGGRLIRLGRFADEEEAARAYDAAALEHFGPNANTNFKRGA